MRGIRRGQGPADEPGGERAPGAAARRAVQHARSGFVVGGFHDPLTIRIRANKKGTQTRRSVPPTQITREIILLFFGGVKK